MSIAAGVKAGVVAAWVLSIAAGMMLMLVAGHYRGGYEDLIRDAATLFFLGLVVALGATIAAAIIRKRTPGVLAIAWLGFAVGHITLSSLVLGSIFALAVSSP